MKNKTWLLVLIIIIGLGLAGFATYKLFFEKSTKSSTSEKSETLQLDKNKLATHLSKVVDTEGAYWQRAFELWWESAESEKGVFDWEETDFRMDELSDLGVYPVVTIKPFANWDQDACHDESYEADSHIPSKENEKTEQKIKVGAPCDIDAYADFLAQAVERYDGDGKDDMEGLTIPVKYWEIMNEPEMQGGGTGGMGEELKFFVGTSAEYFEILKTSYETIKEVDPEAKVLHAGMAGMQENFLDFWTPIFEAGAGKYFDIANMHTINTDESRHDMYILRFKTFLKKYGLEGRPIFVTEVQFGDLVGQPTDLDEFEVLIAKSTIFTLAQGADKLFFIENWLFFDTEKDPENKLKFDSKAITGTTHKVYLNLIDQINSFDKVEILEEDYTKNSGDNEGLTSNTGHYKFSNGDKIIYVLWGGSELPKELQVDGFLKVTDIYGETEEVTAGAGILSSSPVFVEVL
ncbi:hypothetical protein ACFL14_01525 [Patescibacteria group bacterium]